MKTLILILALMTLAGCSTPAVFSGCEKISDNPVLYKGCKQLR